MTSTENLSDQDKDFLAKCEEEFKVRYTDKDEEFMKVFNAETSIPPIIKSWWVPQNSGRRNDRRNNRRHHPYERHNRDYDRREQSDRRDNYNRRDNYERRGYNDYDRGGYDNRGGGSRFYRN